MITMMRLILDGKDPSSFDKKGITNRRKPAVLWYTDVAMLYIVSDHGGFALKRRVAEWLGRKSVSYLDLGPTRLNPTDDYPSFAKKLAEAVARSTQHRGIAICRSGVGMAIVANKHRRIRAVQALTPAIAKQSRRDENTNILSLAADHQNWKSVTATIKQWLETPYKGEPRHARRLQQIKKIEHDR